MNENARLDSSRLIAFVPTTQPARARQFYEGVLGLRLIADDSPFALAFDANGTMLRVTRVNELTPAPFTILGWSVDAIETAVEDLTRAGVEFVRYPGLNESDPKGIWTSPGGARIAWFHDYDGNVLSLTEFRG
jgi:catechol 2,3-dioxygenase-like lactoylglutathione lyase family enzyme